MPPAFKALKTEAVGTSFSFMLYGCFTHKKNLWSLWVAAIHTIYFSHMFNNKIACQIHYYLVAKNHKAYFHVHALDVCMCIMERFPLNFGPSICYLSNI